MSMYATEALMVTIDLQSPQRRRGAIWHITVTGTLSIVLEPVTFALVVTTTLDHRPSTFRKYRFSHRFPNIAMDAVSSEIRKLVYKSRVTMATPPGGVS